MAAQLPIRLTAREVAEILDVSQESANVVGFEILEVSLFGSRTDLNKKGGDIDLYFNVSQGLDLREIRIDLRRRILEKLGDQKLDVVVDDGSTNLGAFRVIIEKSKVVLSR